MALSVPQTLGPADSKRFDSGRAKRWEEANGACGETVNDDAFDCKDMDTGEPSAAGTRTAGTKSLADLAIKGIRGEGGSHSYLNREEDFAVPNGPAARHKVKEKR